MMTNKKPFWKSKTKIGALLVALGIILGTIGAMLQEQISLGVGLQALAIQIGILCGVFGLRDLNVVNGIRINQK